MATKKDLYYNIAQHMFIVEHKTIQEIARDLKQKVSGQSIRNWSAEGEWGKKREEALKARGAFHVEIYNLAQQLSASIREDLEAKKDVAPSRFHVLAKMLDIIPKAKKAEKEIGLPDNKDPELSSLENLLKAIHKSLTEGV